MSWELPSVADTDCACSDLKLSGSAPYLSWSASALAESCSKPPVICVACPLMADSFTGAEITLPSRVNAT